MESILVEKHVSDSRTNLNTPFLQSDLNISINEVKMNDEDSVIITKPLNENDIPALTSSSKSLVQCTLTQENYAELIQLDVEDNANMNIVGEEDIEVVYDDNYQTHAAEIEYDFKINDEDCVIITDPLSGNDIPTLTSSSKSLVECTSTQENDAELIHLDVDDNTNMNIVGEEDIEIVNDNNYQTHAVEIEYDFNHVPHQISGSWKEFESMSRNNFTRGCKWAPDGSCILTCSDDNILKIFNLPEQLWDSSQWQDITEMEAVVKISEGELIYDYCWYPLMNSSDPSTCCLVSTSRNSTVHLWDGFTGELRCTYRTFNHMDEIVTPHSLSFNSDGQKLFCGFEKVVRIFDVDTPGRKFEERRLYAKKSGQPGIISCFAFTSSDKNISAAGSYQKTIGIYSEPSGELECLLEGQKGGVTQLHFSPDGTCLYSGGRKDPEILCWDLRNLGTVLFTLRRSCTTNQRMYFDVSRCGRYVVSGNQNGVITIWDVTKEPKVIKDNEFTVIEPVQFFLGHEDCINGINLHPSYPLLCSSSGQRKFPALLDDEDEEIFSSKIDKRDNSLRLWWIGKLS